MATSTNDLCLAAALKCSGFKMENWEKEGSKTNFIFETTPYIQKFIREYDLGEVVVEPKGFWQETKVLKSIIYRQQS